VEVQPRRRQWVLFPSYLLLLLVVGGYTVAVAPFLRMKNITYWITTVGSLIFVTGTGVFVTTSFTLLKTLQGSTHGPIRTANNLAICMLVFTFLWIVHSFSYRLQVRVSRRLEIGPKETDVQIRTWGAAPQVSSGYSAGTSHMENADGTEYQYQPMQTRVRSLVGKVLGKVISPEVLQLHWLWYLVFTTLITNLNTKWLHPY
jgi:hypothetical protein